MILLPLFLTSTGPYPGKVAGRQRIILGKSAEEMNVPLKIDEEIYFEGKFDTEALLTMMIKKVLEPVGYDYSQIIIQYLLVQSMPIYFPLRSFLNMHSDCHPDAFESWHRIFD